MPFQINIYSHNGKREVYLVDILLRFISDLEKINKLISTMNSTHWKRLNLNRFFRHTTMVSLAESLLLKMPTL